MHEYLGLESGLPIFEQDFTCPALLDMSIIAACTGLSPAMARFSNLFQFTQIDRLVRVRSPLLTESLLISFPAGT
jgi:hypothetical protein